ncbi:hypothetical protein SAMN02910384_01271 [Pseudobutyrivibrio sp. ACV-2]|uniref:hypothetical protein n=1 Tax=Pseudobutyrivibrio sp. ACV-2 TaxID=1520801 RepID=UPI00089C2130|nr:hypothetical protein [Pseudobutyrivibrio sp. ACV-2]SEA31054.1 hypothetical protein SAMN02910384_01271 [Pseudobutyrivibrio sp. ACV-2]
MVIQNSEVSMTSKSSVTRAAKMTVQSEFTPTIHLEGIKVIGDAGKTEKTDETEGEKGASKATIGEEGFLSSLNYALESNGTVQEVAPENPLLNAPANRKVRLHTMEYLIKMLLLGRIFEEDTEFGRMLKENFCEGDNGSYLEGMDYIDNTHPNFVQITKTSYSYHEEQNLAFASQGTAVTADGRKLSFNYNFEMSKTFTQQYDSVIQTAVRRCIDPLVINLDDCPTTITDQTFYFDLDGDGEDDELHNLGGGSGFLALDKNGDGIINDGLELFGAKSGNGFAELAAYDEDGNGWIDENDPIFSKLRIMTITELGEKELYGLKESDVGAIFLGRLDTDFTHRNGNQSSAYTRESGIFLHESDGRAGGVQHVDFAT